MSLKINRILAIIFAIVFLLACKKDDDNNNNQNPFLINPLVNISLNLNLPEYNALNFPGGSVKLAPPQGIKGVIIYNINNSEYSAFELSDPNHTPNSCSRMEIEGVFASCPCTSDDNEYNIVTGQHTSDDNVFPMLRYNAVRNGNTIQVSN